MRISEGISDVEIAYPFEDAVASLADSSDVEIVENPVVQQKELAEWVEQTAVPAEDVLEEAYSAEATAADKTIPPPTMPRNELTAQPQFKTNDDSIPKPPADDASAPVGRASTHTVPARIAETDTKIPPASSGKGGSNYDPPADTKTGGGKDKDDGEGDQGVERHNLDSPQDDIKQKVEYAIGFFGQTFGLEIDAAGKLQSEPSQEQLAALREWHKQTSQDGIIMPDIDTFTSKVVLAQALMPQVDSKGQVQYLFGKGTGAELALQGEVEGREKNLVSVPYRTHSDFEIYGAAAGAYTSLEHADRFRAVFGGQEIFPPEHTKGLRDLPEELLHDTAETVQFGGLTLLVPNLELQFVDKHEKANVSVERGLRAKTDAEWLAKTYDLDDAAVHAAINEFVITPAIAALEPPEEAAPRLLTIFERKITEIKVQFAEEHPGASETEVNAAVRSNIFLTNFARNRGLGDTTSFIDAPTGQLKEDAEATFANAIRAQQAHIAAELHGKHAAVDTVLQPKTMSRGQEQRLHALGYTTEHYATSPLHATFHKENNPALDMCKEKDELRVVTDSDGKNWLLKSTHPNPELQGDFRPEEEAGLALELATHARSELFAYKLAAYIDYPVPETRTVIHDEKAWIAYAYIENHLDITLEAAEQYGVSNPHAVACRHIFNALSGSKWDESHQGIIDPETSTYFAQDLSFGFPAVEATRTIEETRRSIFEDFFTNRAYLGGGGSPSLEEDDKRFALNMLNKALGMTQQEAAEIFASSSHGPAATLQVIKGRAQALIVLINQGIFDRDEDDIIA